MTATVRSEANAVAVMPAPTFKRPIDRAAPTRSHLRHGRPDPPYAAVPRR